MDQALDAARDSWRLALPAPDHLRIEALRGVCAVHPANAKAQGMLALLSRRAAEYADLPAIAAHVAECDASARRALAIVPNQAEASIALATVSPLFGHWLETRERLLEIIDKHPGHEVATQELAIVEMCTGRVRAAKQLIDALIAKDPLAACYSYKSLYHHWSVGDHARMDLIGDRAIQLWPSHPAIWTARFWSLAHTGRGEAALDMLADAIARPKLTANMVAFLQDAVSSAMTGSPADRARMAAEARDLARGGPALAIASLFALCLLGRDDEAFEVTEAYYFRGSDAPVPIHHTAAEPSINEQHRRLTQILFLPLFNPMRADPRFRSLCDRSGLSRYWEVTGLQPDFANQK